MVYKPANITGGAPPSMEPIPCPLVSKPNKKMTPPTIGGALLKRLQRCGKPTMFF